MNFLMFSNDDNIFDTNDTIYFNASVTNLKLFCRVEFSGNPVVKTLRFHRTGHGFVPGN